jgi:hypothetical protein
MFRALLELGEWSKISLQLKKIISARKNMNQDCNKYFTICLAKRLLTDSLKAISPPSTTPNPQQQY